LNTISATTLSQRTAYAAAFGQTASATFAMDAMLRRRPDHLKMPPLDAYDQLSLAVLLCKSGHTELAGNDIDAARAALAAAEKVIEAAGAGPGTEAARAVSKLRRALAL